MIAQQVLQHLLVLVFGQFRERMCRVNQVGGEVVCRLLLHWHDDERIGCDKVDRQERGQRDRQRDGRARKQRTGTEYHGSPPAGVNW